MKSADQHLRRIEHTLEEHPDIRQRTAAFLADEPSMKTMEALMDDKLESTLVVKVHPSVLRRADALQPQLTASPQFQAMGRLTRSAVIRLAILRGLEALERDVSSVGEPLVDDHRPIEMVPAPPTDTTPTPAHSKKRPLKGIHQQIVDALRPHPEGLSPAEMRQLLGIDKDLRDTMKGMVTAGMLIHLGYGGYTVAEGR